MLKSAPLKSAFPVCPPRTPPSPAPLLASVRSLIQSGVLRGDVWKSTATWRAQIRKAFATYHAELKSLAEEIVSERSFALEFYIFLENISQPIQLLQLIADDFESEFGPGATRGLLGVGEAGGDNLVSVMDFCAARKPSELLARVKQRVAEKQERERRVKRLDALRGELKGLDTRIRALLLKYRNGGVGAKPGPGVDGEREGEGEGEAVSAPAEADSCIDEMHRLQRELEAALDSRDAVKAEVAELQGKEDEDERARRRERAEKERVLAEAGVRVDQEGKLAPVPPTTADGADAPAVEAPASLGFKLGSSKDLLPLPVASPSPSDPSAPPAAPAPFDPFSTHAPRAPPSSAATLGSAKGKARAPYLLTPSSRSRTGDSTTRGAGGQPRARYAPPPPAHRHAIGFGNAVPTLPGAGEREHDAETTVVVQVPPPRRKRAHKAGSSEGSASPSRRGARPRRGVGASRARRETPGSTSRPGSRAGTEGTGADAGERERDADEHCEVCCPACAAEARRAREDSAARDEADEGQVGPKEGARGEGVSQEADVQEEGSAPTSEEARDDETDVQAVPLAETTNVAYAVGVTEGGGAVGGGSGGGAKRKRKKKKGGASAVPMTTKTTTTTPADAIATSAPLPIPPTSLLPGFSPLSRHPPPKCCPPHRCTGVAANYAAWAELDGLLYETILEGFKCASRCLLLACACAPRARDSPTLVDRNRRAHRRAPLSAVSPARQARKELYPRRRPHDDRLGRAKGDGLVPDSFFGEGHVALGGPSGDPGMESTRARHQHAEARRRPRACFPSSCRTTPRASRPHSRMSRDAHTARHARRKHLHLQAVAAPRHPARGTAPPRAVRAGRPADPDRPARDGPAGVHEVVPRPASRQGASHLLSSRLSALGIDREHALPQKLAGPEWEGLNRQYIVQDYLLAFSDAFDAAMDRLMLVDPFVLAEDMCTLLEWQGGVRAFDTALRFGRQNIVDEYGTGVELLEGKEEGPPERRPLQAWGRLLELSAEARTKGIAFSRDLAEQEKQRVRCPSSSRCLSFGDDSPSLDVRAYAGQRLLCRWRARKGHRVVHDGVHHLPDGADVPEQLCRCAHEDRTVRRGRVRLHVGARRGRQEHQGAVQARDRARHARTLEVGLCRCVRLLIPSIGVARGATELTSWRGPTADLKYLERIAPDCQPAKEALLWATQRYNAVKPR